LTFTIDGVKFFDLISFGEVTVEVFRKQNEKGEN
jgi:hypothetical protein